MFNTNDFVGFAIGTGANVEAPASWKQETVVQQGMQNGIANPTWANTAWRQATSIAAMIAQFTANYGTSNVQDNGDLTTLLNQFITALSLFVSETLPTQLLYNGTDGGTQNAASVATPSPTLSSVNKWDAFLIQKVSTSNTGPMTLNVAGTNGTLQWADGTALIANDWPGSSIALIVYDGTKYNILSVIGPSVFARVGQIPPSASLVHYGTDSGSANAISVGTVVPPVTSVTAGMLFEITKAGTASTGAMTATIAGQEGNLQWADGSAMASGDWPANAKALIEFDGANYNVMSVMGPSVFARASTAPSVNRGTALTLTNGSTVAVSSGVYTAAPIGTGTCAFATSDGTKITFSNGGLFAFYIQMSIGVATSSASDVDYAIQIEQNGSVVASSEDNSQTASGTKTPLESLNAVLFVEPGDQISFLGMTYAYPGYSSGALEGNTIRVEQIY